MIPSEITAAENIFSFIPGQMRGLYVQATLIRNYPTGGIKANASSSSGFAQAREPPTPAVPKELARARKRRAGGRADLMLSRRPGKSPRRRVSASAGFLPCSLIKGSTAETLLSR